MSPEAASAALGRKNLVLVGFMGTGKSTVGRLAASALRRGFVDLDAWVEAEAGASVAEIFAAEGEAGFRARESAAVARFAPAGGRVIATGGGVLSRAENAAALRAGGVLAALHAPAEVILARVGAQDAGTLRPMLRGSDPLRRIRELLAARTPWYAQADIALETGALSPAEAAAALIDRLSRIGAAAAGQGGG